MRKFNLIATIIVSFLCAPMFINAETNVKGTIIGNDVLIGKNPNTTVSSCLLPTGNSERSKYAEPGVLHCLDTNDEVTILNYDSIIQSTISSCSKGYYYVKSSYPNDGKNHYGYVCADKIVTSVDTSEYAQEFRNSNIPEIYWNKLALLKKAHPNWKFTGYITNLDWNTVISEEEGSNAIQSSNPIYLSLESYSYDVATNSYKQLETGGWYFANKPTIAYYMDPRNFMDEKSIFMFENLNYNGTYQTLDVVNKVLQGTALAPYAQTFVDAAQYDGISISPVMLAALSRQEVVVSNGLSDAANGSSYLDKGVFYNFYNYGSYSKCTLDNETEGHTIQCGLKFAYEHGWTTPEFAIKDGAKIIARSYINNGQNTLYLKKFNVTPNGTYSFQYQTNVKAPYSEGNATANSYSNINGLLDSSFEFIIPVYNNMPENAATLPTTVDNKALEEKKQEQNNVSVSTSITNAGYSIVGSYLMGTKIGETAANMLSKIGNGVSVTRDGNNMSGNESLGTADILHANGNSYRIIVNGDVNGDGSITPADYVRIKNSIMGSSSLSGSFKQAADVNGDGNVTPADYVNVKNYIMGASSTLR